MVDKETVSNRLKEAFDFPHNGFSSPLSWSDGVGVSRVKDLPGEHASIYKIGIINEELNKESGRNKLSISVYYGKKILEGISLGSEESLSRPVDFDNRDEFSFDIDSQTFFQKDKQLSAENLLDVLEERHMRPTQMGRGFLLRSYLWFWRRLLPSLVTLVDYFILSLLWIISGETLKKDFMGKRDLLGRLVGGLGTEKTKEGIKDKYEFTVGKPMDFFGYPAKRWSVVFYCGIHLVLFFVFLKYSVRNSVVENIFSNNFTTLCYVIVSFAITEAGIPRLLKYLIEQTPQLYGHISFMRLKLWG